MREQCGGVHLPSRVKPPWSGNAQGWHTGLPAACRRADREPAAPESSANPELLRPSVQLGTFRAEDKLDER